MDAVSAKLRAALTAEDAALCLYHWDALRHVLQDISEEAPVAIDASKLDCIRNRYSVGAISPDDGYLSTKEPSILAQLWGVSESQAQAFVRRLLLNPGITQFCIGIKNTTAKMGWRNALVHRMTSGAKSYTGRGYTHMLAFFASTSRGTVECMERLLHDRFASDARWDPQCYNTKGGKPRTQSPYHLVYVVFRLESA